MNLLIETSNLCNVACVACPMIEQEQSRGVMPLDMYEEVIRQVKDLPVDVIYPHCWGEPCLNPDICTMLELAYGVSTTVSIVTNATLITPEIASAMALCDVVSVSMGGIDSQSYFRYHRRDCFSDAMHGVRLLRQAMGDREIRWTFVVLSVNEHLLQRAEKRAERIGLRFRPKSAYLTDLDLLPCSESSRRYSMNGKARKNRSACREFSNTLYVMADGTIATCCYDWDVRFPVGHIEHDSLIDVWNGEKYRRLRSIQNSGDLTGLCQERCGDLVKDEKRHQVSNLKGSA